VLLIGIFVVYVLATAIRRWGSRSGIGLSAIATLMLFAAQIVVGAAAAVTDTAFFNGFHVALATLVWCGVLTFALLTLPRADGSMVVSHLSVEKSSA
jgi:hypothetical protein